MEIKHTFLFTLILGLAWTGLLFAFSSGPDPAMNGIASPTQTCAMAGCHSSFPLNSGGGSVSVSGLPSAWAAGQTYPLTVTIQRANQRAFGFQLSAVVDATNRQAGSFAAAGNVQIKCGGLNSNLLNCSNSSAIQFAEHRSPLSGSGTGTFTLNWAAPSDTSLGTIRFNVAGNAANGNGNNDGDYIFTQVYTVPAAAAPPPPDLSTRAFSIVDRGGSSIISDGGGDLNIGFSRIQPASGSTTPAGVAIFGGRSNNVLFTEAGVPAAPTLTRARIYAEINASVNTGIAIANPNAQAANITFHFATNSSVMADQTLSIPAGTQIAKYLSESAFGLAAGTTLQGTFTFTSDVPVGVIALRLLRNERNEEILTTLPVTDLSPAAPPPTSGTAYLGHFADGNGATSQVILVNPTDSAIAGTIQFFGQGTTTTAATAISMGTNAGTATSFSYNIPRQSSFKLTTTGAANTLGSVRVTSGTGSVVPSALVVFSYRRNNITVSEAGVPAMQGSTFRMYVETNSAGGDPGTIQTGVAIANLSAAPTTVNLELMTLDGTPASQVVPVNLPGNGQIGKFAHELFTNMPFPFKGIIRVSGGTTIGLAVVALRLRYNERGDFMMTTTPPSNEGAVPTSAELLFPHFVNGSVSGLTYTTQFILFSGSAGQNSSGNLRFFQNNGSPLSLNVN